MSSTCASRRHTSTYVTSKKTRRRRVRPRVSRRVDDDDTDSSSTNGSYRRDTFFAHLSSDNTREHSQGLRRWLRTEKACKLPRISRPSDALERSSFSRSREYATNFDSHYLWDLALSNVSIVLYRCERADLPLRTWSNGCGMRAEERLLLPNHGRDAAAFYDYAAWRYDAPSQAVAFLHGHGALAWHTSCETVFTRVTAYHEYLVRRNASSSTGVLEVDGNFLDTTTLTFARGRKETKFEPLKWNGGKKRRRLLRTSYVDAEQHPETSGRNCRAVLNKVGVPPLKRAPGDELLR